MSQKPIVKKLVDTWQPWHHMKKNILLRSCVAKMSMAAGLEEEALTLLLVLVGSGLIICLSGMNQSMQLGLLTQVAPVCLAMCMLQLICVHWSVMDLDLLWLRDAIHLILLFAWLNMVRPHLNIIVEKLFAKFSLSEIFYKNIIHLRRVCQIWCLYIFLEKLLETCRIRTSNEFFFNILFVVFYDFFSWLDTVFERFFKGSYGLNMYENIVAVDEVFPKCFLVILI